MPIVIREKAQRKVLRFELPVGAELLKAQQVTASNKSLIISD